MLLASVNCLSCCCNCVRRAASNTCIPLPASFTLYVCASPNWNLVSNQLENNLCFSWCCVLLEPFLTDLLVFIFLMNFSWWQFLLSKFSHQVTVSAVHYCFSSTLIICCMCNISPQGVGVSVLNFFEETEYPPCCPTRFPLVCSTYPLIFK